MASKAAGFVGARDAGVRRLPAAGDVYEPFLWVMAALTMTVGNVVALRQTNIVRMLAYSSVSQGGFILMPLAVLATRDAAESSLKSVVIYLLIYAFIEPRCVRRRDRRVAQDAQRRDLLASVGCSATPPGSPC